MPASPLPPLSLLEARVLGVLVEKEQTVPDTYPLTLNALTAGCNQKTSRNPVLDASESEVLEAVERLRALSFVIESSGGRTMRYAQNVKRVLNLPSPAVALLATLALRGPQTAAELRANGERIHRFADVSSVEGFLREMAERPEGALVVLLPRQPGAREARWTHLLGGAAAPAGTSDAGAANQGSREHTGAGAVPQGMHEQAGTTMPEIRAAGALDTGALEARVARLEEELAELKARVERLSGERDSP